MCNSLHVTRHVTRHTSHVTSLTYPTGWSPTNPDSITQASFDNIINTVGTRGSSTRRLGISVQLPVFFTPASSVTAFLQKLLSMCQANDVPVAFTLDAFEFWECKHPQPA